MASTINADNGVVSGSAGLKHYSDASGNLEFQTNGITAISVDSNQKVSFPGTISANLAGGNIGTIIVQTDANVTGFISAPSSANTLLQWDGSNFIWAAAPTGNANFANIANAVAWANVTSKPTTTSGYGITDAVTLTTTQEISGAKTFNTTIVANISGAASTISNGASNQIVYQTGASTTSFITAPTDTDTYLKYNGSGFAWSAVAAGVAITDDTATSATYYPVVSTVSSGSMTAKVSSTKFTFNPSTGTLSSTIFNSLSDVNSKKNIVDLDNVEAVLRLLRGVSFDFIDGEMHSSGYIAQELQKLIPHAVTEIDGKLTVNYAAVMPYISEGWKRHDARLSTLEEIVAKLSK
jgi:hypothetical protein